MSADDMDDILLVDFVHEIYAQASMYTHVTFILTLATMCMFCEFVWYLSPIKTGTLPVVFMTAFYHLK